MMRSWLELPAIDAAYHRVLEAIPIRVARIVTDLQRVLHGDSRLRMSSIEASEHRDVNMSDKMISRPSNTGVTAFALPEL